MTDLSPLATFAAASAPVGQAVAAEGQLTADAVSLSAAEGASLVAYRPDGFGWVAFAAIDPALAPFKGWDGLGGFFRAILAISTNRPDWATGIFNWSSAEQAAKAVPGLIVPSPWEICGFLALYIIVVGPLNYLVLRRFKHRSWAWFTIPAVVLVFSAGAYVTGYQLRGTEAVLHRLTVVEVWPGAERAQAEQIVGLFSPRRTTYAVTFEPDIVAKPLPYASFAPPNAAREVVEQADQTRLPQVRTEIGAVNVYIAQGQVPSPHFASSLTQHFGGALAKGGATLEGSLSNQSNLTLTDAVLLAPGGSQRLGSIQPGQSVNIAPLLLSNQRATPASANGALPSSRPYIPVAAPQGALSGQDTTFSDILGTAPISNQEEYRRNMLLSAILDQYGGGERGNGVYLAGWTSTSPFNATLSAPFRTLDLSLYLVALPYTLDFGQGTLTLPPGWMTWASLNTDNGQYTPYDTQLAPSGTMAFQFAPYQPVVYQAVHGLTLHFAGYGAGTLPAALKVELWDFTAAAWLEQPKLSWGDNGITPPARFVGPQGEILVRVTNVGGASENIQQVDFTLDVDR